MNFLRNQRNHTVYLYVLAFLFMALAFLGGYTWNQTPQNTWRRMLCDGFSMGVTFYLLAVYFYRPKTCGLREALRYAFGVIRNTRPNPAFPQDEKLQSEVRMPFMDALFLSIIYGVGLMGSLLLYGIFS